MSNISSSNSQGVRVPKLRFPGFEGEWEEKSFSDVATGFDYGMNAATGLYDGVNKYIRITDIDEDSRCYIDANPVSPQGNLDDKYLVHEHDILFARTGASTGKTYLYKKSDGKLYFAGFLIRISVNCDNNSTFVYNATLTDRYNRWVRLTSMRSGQPGINSQEYSSYKTYYPLLPEQNKIASFLKKLDQRIEKQRQLVELLKSYKRGVSKRLFSSAATYAPTVVLKDYANISTGCSNTQDAIPDGEYPFFIRSQTVARSNRYIFDGEAVLTIGDGQIGKVFHYINGKFDCHQRVYMITQFSQYLNGKYFYHYFSEHFYDRAIRMSAKNTVDSVRMEMIADMPITLPDVKAQNQIVNILDSIDFQIGKGEMILSNLSLMKQGLLQQLFI